MDQERREFIRIASALSVALGVTCPDIFEPVGF